MAVLQASMNAAEVRAPTSAINIAIAFQSRTENRCMTRYQELEGRVVSLELVDYRFQGPAGHPWHTFGKRIKEVRDLR
jgi:hypothetical protein